MVAGKHLMIAVNWFGPLSGDLCAIRTIARDDFTDGLYMCVGMRPYQRKASLQYVGIGNPLHARMHDGHHALPHVTRERKIWLGEIATAEPSGKKMKVTKASLDYAEWLHAYFLQLPLNDKKRSGLPTRSVTVLNRWWRASNYDRIRSNRPVPEWPDLIDFPGHGLPARTVWFGGRQRIFTSPDY